MNPDHEETIFATALALQPGQRAAYLDEACAENAELRRHIQELLEAHESESRILTSPVSPVVRSTIALNLQPSEQVGDRIGRYKLLEQIGEGGCGVVYAAEQEEPVRRRVALKVIKLGMDTRQVLARFEAERQALAIMDHPNIARVFDAGASNAGRPYFVMELVRGIKITEYCDLNNLSTEGRLKLFIQVCRAIQHAHQKGVIHRDIKPANILVTINDGVPVPKVIDFGIAKATQGKLTDQTVYTAFEQFIGTPAYMSPEQAEMTSLDIDTRSDIYSLGVLLYELLTSKTPFEARALMEAGLNAMRQTIRELEPPRPSTRLSTMDAHDLTLTARRRRTDAPKLVHEIRGDLDWIVMKSLEKDRTRRYETANGLAADVQRHLDSEPVLARPPSTSYQLQKWISRNKYFFAGASAVMLTLLVGLGLFAWQFLERKKALDRAIGAEKQATGEALKSTEIARFFEDMLQGVGPEVAKGRDTKLLRSILENAEHRISAELRARPEIASELLSTIAGIYHQLAESHKSEELGREALRLQKSAVGPEHPSIALLLGRLAISLQAKGDFENAESTLRSAIDLGKKVLPLGHPETAIALAGLGLVLRGRGDLLGAEQALREAISRRSNLAPSDIAATAYFENDLAVVLLNSGRLREAEALFLQTLEQQRKIDQDQPALATTLGNLGMVQWELGDLANAEVSQRKSLEMKQRLLGTEDHPLVAASYNNLGLVMRDRGDLAAAETAQRKSLAIASRMVPLNHPDLLASKRNLADTLRRCGVAQGELGLLREALTLNPVDNAVAEALACWFARPSLHWLLPDAPDKRLQWQFAFVQPGSDWAQAGSSKTGWQSGEMVIGYPKFVPRTDHGSTPHTNIWLRHEFELKQVPIGRLLILKGRNSDGQVFLNGIKAVPDADWNDADVLLAVTETARASLKPGRNVLAIHCRDVDGGTPIDFRLCVMDESSSGWRLLQKELDELIGAKPERAELCEARANIHGRAGRWGEAAKDLETAARQQPNDANLWWRLAPLLIESGQLDAYERHRNAALTQFAQTKSLLAAERIARLGLLLPADENSLKSATRLAKQAAIATYTDSQLPARQFTRALAAYRDSDMNVAATWLEKSSSSSSDPTVPAWSYERQRNLAVAIGSLRALICQTQQRHNEARVALNEATKLARDEMAALENMDVGRDWPGWLTAHILLKEASKSLGHTAGEK